MSETSSVAPAASEIKGVLSIEAKAASFSVPEFTSVLPV